jgi:hypothetical protein
MASGMLKVNKLEIRFAHGANFISLFFAKKSFNYSYKLVGVGHRIWNKDLDILREGKRGG